VEAGRRSRLNAGGVARAARREWGLLALVIVTLVYVANAWTPSSYAHAGQMFGIPHSGAVLGKPRAIRSDEWAVATPYFQIAVANDLGPRNELSPYREPLKGFFALPSRDWSMALKPDLWGFLALDPAHAFSLHYAVLALAFVAGFTVLLRQLGCSPGFALAVGGTLFLSQFVQLWWTSNAPVLAYAPWPVVAYLWQAPWWRRGPAIALAVAVWLIGQLYPPFAVAAGFAFGFLLLAFRPQALAPSRLVVGVVAAAVGAGVAWLHYSELIPVMAATVYPGQRIASGGGVSMAWILAQAFPYLATQQFEPLARWATNACEIAVVGSLLPLAVLTFCDHRRLLGWIATHLRAVVVWVLGLGLMAAWMVLPIPGEHLPLVNLVPSGRMLWGMGLLFLLGFGVIASQAEWKETARRRAVFLALAVAAWVLSKLVLSKTPIEFDGFDLVVVPVLLIVMFARSFRPDLLPPRRAVMLVVIATAFLSFGQFNPVQPAGPIFERRPSPILDSFRAYAAANPKGWVVVPGIYGAAVNGAGVPAINHTLLQPQLAVFRQAYPELEPAVFNETFNRYAFAVPSIQWAPSVPQPDVVLIPPDPFAIPLPAEVAPPPDGLLAQGAVDAFDAVRLGPRRWGVAAGGWADWSGVAPGQALRVSLADPALGRIVKVSAYRLPRPGAVVERNDPSAFAAGFGVRLEIETTAELASFPKTALRLVSVDPARGVHLVPNGS